MMFDDSNPSKLRSGIYLTTFIIWAFYIFGAQVDYESIAFIRFESAPPELTILLVISIVGALQSGLLIWISRFELKIAVTRELREEVRSNGGDFSAIVGSLNEMENEVRRLKELRPPDFATLIKEYMTSGQLLQKSAKEVIDEANDLLAQIRSDYSNISFTTERIDEDPGVTKVAIQRTLSRISGKFDSFTDSVGAQFHDFSNSISGLASDATKLRSLEQTIRNSMIEMEGDLQLVKSANSVANLSKLFDGLDKSIQAKLRYIRFAHYWLPICLGILNFLFVMLFYFRNQ
jgi:hypothetical protein